MHQMTMFDILEPKPKRQPYIPPIMRDVRTSAYASGGVMQVREGEPDPIEIMVRGIPCVISFSFGFATRAVQPPGSPFWSETGFRNFSVSSGWEDAPDKIAGVIEAYIDGPTKDGGGCGGKLTRWWPSYILQWRGNLAFSLGRDRSTIWEQWGPERHAELWAKHDANNAEALARMVADGIDPNDVGPSSHFKGKWPKFGPDLFSSEARG